MLDVKGTKYQKYEGDELKILRLLFIDKDNNYHMVCNNHKVVINEDEFHKLIALEPDGLMNIMSTITKEGNKDIFICVHKEIDIEQNNMTPAMIIRQDVYSNSKNAFNGIGNIYVGDCYRTLNMNKNDIYNVMEFEKIEKTDSFSLYIDDSFDDILNIVNKSSKQFDDVLVEIQKDKPNNIMGYCSSIKELMKTNNFMLNYRGIFNIMQLEFPIDIKDNRNNNGDIILNKKQQHLLEDQLQKYITNIAVLKYDKDIDISKIVSTTHIMVSDKYDKIYLISYSIISNYPVDDDVANAMNYNLN